ncbi:MAG TPA: alpha/beta fold hydrolase [Microcoleaceae cyanobacterium]
MPDYAAATKAIALSAKTRETQLPLLSDRCASRFFLHPQPTERVCLFFHGFTAGPHQFVPMGEMFYRAGYNVLIPLLPGHGEAGAWSKTNPPPLPTDPLVYQKFALEWLEKAQSLGKQVIVGGLSAGGTMTAWLALERPQAIYRALMFAAYLSSSSKVVDLMVKSMNTYFEWISTDSPIAPGGYKGFSLPALRVFLNMGSDILSRAPKQATPPMFIVSSESDIAVGNFDHKGLFTTLVKRQPITWYHCFNKYLAIPHTMMTKVEGNQWEGVLNTMARSFVESSLTWAEVEEIGYRMTQGKTFDQVVAELGIAAKASRDMPAMMTMVDKLAIVEARNPFLNRRRV